MMKKAMPRTRAQRAVRGFTLVELMVVVSVIAILSTMVFFGIGGTRSDEGLKADYLEFLSNLKSLQTRANLGQLAPTIAPTTAPTSKHTIVFTLSAAGATSYSIDGVTVNFKNGSKITSVNSNNSGVVTISFVPNSSNYQGPTPKAGFFAALDAAALTSPVTITLTGKSLATKNIVISGITFYISNIN